MKIQKNFRLEEEVIEDIKYIQRHLNKTTRLTLTDTDTVSYAIRITAQQLKDSIEKEEK